MDFAELLAEIQHLKAEELAQLKALIAEREHELSEQKHSYTVTEWDKLVNEFLEEFWDDTPADEKEQILNAIRYKNIPLDRIV